MTDRSAENERSVDVAAAAWADALAADGAVGSLASATGTTLVLDDADPVALAGLLAGKPTKLRSLVRDPASHAAAVRRARAIRDAARTFAEQAGLDADVLAIGLASWAGAGGNAPAPVVLRPLRVTARTASEDDVDLTIGGSAQVNPLLVEALQRLVGQPLYLPDPAADVQGAAEPTALYDALRAYAAAVPDFAVEHHLVAGTFSAAPARVAADLTASADLLANSAVVAALAGDSAMIERLRAPLLPGAVSAGATPAAPAAGPEGPVPGTGRSDGPDPGGHVLVVDADAAQVAAVANALAGRSFVVEGGPGTGRTQTAVAMTGALLAAGRRVLLLAQQRATLVTLRDRLAAAGLGPAVLDGSDDAAAGRLAAAIGAEPGPAPAPVVPAEALRAAHAALCAADAALHDPRPPWGLSVYAAHVALLAAGPESTTRVRLRGDTLAAMYGDTLAEARAAVREWAELGGATLTAVDTPWYGARIPSAAEAEVAQRLAAELAETIYPAARARVESALAEAGLAPTVSVADWRGALDLLRDVAATEQVLTPAVWAAPLPELLAATAERHQRRQHGDRLGAGARFDARRAAYRLWRGPKPERAELHAALAQAAAQLTAWSALGRRESTPCVVDDLDAARTAYAALLDALAALQLRLGDRDLSRLPPTVLDKTLRGLAADPTVHRMPRLAELGARCDELGLRPLLLDLTARRVPAAQVPAIVEHAWLASVLDAVATTDPRYGRFDGEALRRAAEEFRRADAEMVAAAGTRVARQVAQRAAAASGAYPNQTAAVSGPATRGSSRRLLEAAPDVTLGAAPCWLLAPLAVPDALPPAQLFDVVIVEDAGTVAVPHAVPALMRARSAVLLGDRRALPPTGLRGLEGDGADDVPAPGTSVLDGLRTVLPVVRLDNCRRGDERMVAFAAATVYRGLRTTPTASPDDPIDVVRVPHRSGVPGQEESATAEVQKVVGLIIDAAVRRPHLSLGVVTIGPVHAARIAAALRVALTGRPELGDIFRADGDERFFVKPCSRVQGDVRDAILFSTGFGLTPDGQLRPEFGPLDGPAGDRLLSVGLTRARSRLTVVTSFGSAEMDPAALRTPGARLLRALLRYVELPESRQTPYAEPPRPDSLDLDIRHRLRSAGLPAVADWGRGPARVPLALAHPDEDGRMVLAIETDGPQAHALSAVRDRHRLRPDDLGRFGWAHHRIWAVDWCRDPLAEVERVRSAYDDALRASSLLS